MDARTIPLSILLVKNSVTTLCRCVDHHNHVLRRVHTTYDILIDMSRDQSRRRVDMSRTVFFCQSTCQADRRSVSFQQRMSIDRLQCGRMSVDIDGVELDKH